MSTADTIVRVRWPLRGGAGAGVPGFGAVGSGDGPAGREDGDGSGMRHLPTNRRRPPRLEHDVLEDVVVLVGDRHLQVATGFDTGFLEVVVNPERPPDDVHLGRLVCGGQ